MRRRLLEIEAAYVQLSKTPFLLRTCALFLCFVKASFLHHHQYYPGPAIDTINSTTCIRPFPCARARSRLPLTKTRHHLAGLAG